MGNLSFYTTEEQIHELFGKSGDIKKIIMGLDKVKKTACGFCFVEYPSAGRVLALGLGSKTFFLGFCWSRASLRCTAFVGPGVVLLSLCVLSELSGLTDPCTVFFNKFLRYYARGDAENAMRYINGTRLDDRIIRTDWDAGFKEGRQYGRGRSGGQVGCLLSEGLVTVSLLLFEWTHPEQLKEQQLQRC